MRAIWNGKQGKVIVEQVGRIYIEFLDGSGSQWILRTGDLHLKNEGRPRKYATAAEKQRAYRERKAGKPLRKWGKK